jgi:hypothetical protein
MARDQIAFGWPELDEAWTRITAAFAFYGKTIRPLRGTRRDHMSRLIADGYTADELVAAVHGYVHWHKGLEPRMGRDGKPFEPLQWFTPDSVYRLEKLENRIEFGMAGPYQSRRNVAQERAQAAQDAREREVAKVMEERRLRAV